MPRGSVHRESGVLIGRDGRFALRRDDGGTWRLDPNGKEGAIRRMLGCRVHLTGIRDGFDLLAVKTVEQA